MGWPRRSERLVGLCLHELDSPHDVSDIRSGQQPALGDNTSQDQRCCDTEASGWETAELGWRIEEFAEAGEVWLLGRLKDNFNRPNASHHQFVPPVHCRSRVFTWSYQEGRTLNALESWKEFEVTIRLREGVTKQAVALAHSSHKRTGTGRGALPHLVSNVGLSCNSADCELHSQPPTCFAGRIECSVAMGIWLRSHSWSTCW